MQSPQQPGFGGHGRTPRVRLQRVLADAGVAARRVCERLIEEGRVEVNGELVRTLPAFVDPSEDHIVVDGRPIPRQGGWGPRKHYIILHKPERTLTTASDEPGMERRTVLDLIDHPAKPRLFPVGRLGWDETGLVLLTNDGELANRLTHPRFGVAKTYLAIVKGDVNETDLRRMTKEMFKLQRLASRQAGRLRSARVELSIFKKDPGKTTLRVTMKEGKNRYVADVLGQAGFPVRKVAAVSIGPLQLRGLPLGAWRELERDEVKMLRQACKEGAAAAKKSGLSAASRARPAALRPSAIPGQRPERSTRSGRGPERGKSSTPSPRYASGGSSKRKIRSARQDQP